MNGKKQMDLGLFIIAVVAIAAFALLAMRFTQPTETNLDGIRIFSHGSAKEALKQTLSKPLLVIEQDLYEGMDARNSMVGIVSSEITHSLAEYRKTVFVYGKVEGGEDIGCGELNHYCSQPDIIVRSGDCNCLKTGYPIEIEGTPDFLYNSTTKFRGIFELVLNELAQENNQTSG
ncbi:MAG: hypothetical protein V1834_01645 [Candidatus Micrarchaeota archaeon]